MDNLSFLLGLNANSGGGTATTPTWSEVENKPFETIGTGLTVTAGALEATGGGSGITPSWSEVTGKPFSTVDTSTGLTIVDDTLMLDTLDHVATIDYVNEQINGVTSTLESDYAQKSDLATVATTGSYNDLEDKLEFWSNYGISLNQDEQDENAYQFEIDEYDIGFQDKVGTAAYEAGYRKPEDISYNDLQDKPSIPTVPTNVGAFTNDAGYITDTALTPYVESSDLATVATSGDYDDLINKPTIPTIPTNISSFTNDAGYITSAATTGLATESYVNTALTPYVTETALTPYVQASALTTVAYSGSYNDLEDKPTIPTATSVTVTQGLTTGVTVGSIDVDGVTTTLYAPAGGGSAPTPNWNATIGQDGYIDNKPPITYGGYKNTAVGPSTSVATNSNAFGYNNNLGGAGNAFAFGHDNTAGSAGYAIGHNNNINQSNAFLTGFGLKANNAACFVRGKFNKAIGSYLDILGNGTGENDNERSNAEATDQSGNKFLAGDVYTNVSDWANPTSNSIKLEPVSIANAITTGVAIADIQIGAATTTLYAPAGGGGTGVTPNWTASSTQAGYIDNKPSIRAGSGIYSIEEGDFGTNHATGNYSHAEGHNACAYGPYSHVEGNDNVASTTSYSAHAEGQGTYAGSNYQHVQGQYNITDRNSKYADIIGNGTGNTPSNAEATDWDGNKYLAGDVYVNVADWSNPKSDGNSIQLANIPKPNFTDLQVEQGATYGTWILKLVCTIDYFDGDEAPYFSYNWETEEYVAPPEEPEEP